MYVAVLEGVQLAPFKEQCTEIIRDALAARRDEEEAGGAERQRCPVLHALANVALKHSAAWLSTEFQRSRLKNFQLGICFF